MRHRWLNGQVVAEYKVIMTAYFPRMSDEVLFDKRTISVNILPVFLFQRVGQYQHEKQEEHYCHPDLNPLGRRWFTQINQEIDEISDIGIVFRFRKCPRFIQF